MWATHSVSFRLVVPGAGEGKQTGTNLSAPAGFNGAGNGNVIPDDPATAAARDAS